MVTAKKSEPVELTAEEKLTARRDMLKTWKSHSALIGMKVHIVGIVPNPDPEAPHKTMEIDLGQMTATLNKKPGKNYNFHAGGKTPDPTEPGMATENVFQVGINITACKSKEW